MRTIPVLFFAAALTLCLNACNQSSSSTHDADVKTIRDAETRWNAEYKAKDATRITAHYTDDAILMTPGEQPVQGKDAIENALKPMIDDPALELIFHADKIDVAKSGDLAYTQGSYTLTLTDPVSHKVIHDRGSYVTTYRKQTDGAWKAVADIATSAVPPTPAKTTVKAHAPKPKARKGARGR